MSWLSSFLHDTRGSSAVEMVLIMPIMIILLFGAVEVGYYFYVEHQVIRGTREAARFAARKVILTAGTCPAASTVETDTLNRLYASAPAVTSWAGTTVSINCNSGFTTGLYSGGTGYDPSASESGPVLTINATGTTSTMFSFLGFVDTNWTINSKQHAAVIGL